MVFPALLSDIVASLRDDHLELTAYLNEICDRIEASDPQVQALLPEANRKVRLMKEAVAYCGIVGFKPSYGRISTGGLIFFSESADHVGIFTQDVAGMTLAASILCSDWRPFTEGSRLPVLGVPDGPYLKQASAEGLAAFERQLALLEEAGYSVRRVPALEDIASIDRRHRKMIAAEMAQVHAQWFLHNEPLYRPQTAALIREGREVKLEELAEGRASRGRVRAQLETLMAESRIDLWVSPAALGPAPKGIGSTGDPAMNMPWTHAGLPAVTLPAGLASSGLPLGLQLVARFMADERLLGWAEVLGKILDKKRSG